MRIASGLYHMTPGGYGAPFFVPGKHQNRRRLVVAVSIDVQRNELDLKIEDRPHEHRTAYFRIETRFIQELDRSSTGRTAPSVVSTISMAMFETSRFSASCRLDSMYLFQKSDLLMSE